MTITDELVQKIDDLMSYGLPSGLGDGTSGNMCVEALICNVLGEPHGDNPSCVAPAVRAAKITLNDARWSSNAARAKGMRDCAIAQLGSRGTVNEMKFVSILALETVRQILPISLRLIGLHVQAESCANVQDLESAESAAKAAAKAARWAAERAAKAARWAAERAAERAAESAAESARWAAKAARWAAERAAESAERAEWAARWAAKAAERAAESAEWAAESAAESARWAAESAERAAERAAESAERAEWAARDSILEKFAAIIVAALKECGSPGCAFI